MPTRSDSHAIERAMRQLVPTQCHLEFRDYATGNMHSVSPQHVAVREERAGTERRPRLGDGSLQLEVVTGLRLGI